MGNISIVNLSNYTSPVIEENIYKGYVTFGDGNSYFDYLIDRTNGSATNGAIMAKVKKIIYGKGLESKALNEIISEKEQKKLVSDLKELGQCAIQVSTTEEGKKVTGTHFPIQYLAPEIQDAKGVVNKYYYSENFDAQTGSKPKSMKAYKPDVVGNSILYIRAYSSGMKYFTLPSHNGGLPYAELEEEIANYHINNVKNGLAPSMLINMNNGSPDKAVKKQVEADVVRKYGGSSNAGRVIISWNESKETEATITAIPLSDASEQYQFLSSECQNKLSTAHGATSALLFGLSSSTGFSNNSEELKTAMILFETLEVQDFRDLLIDAFDTLMEHNGVKEDLEFTTLNPFMDEITEEEKVTVVEKKTNLSKEPIFTDFTFLDWIDGDLDGEQWEMIDEQDVNYDNEDALNFQIGKLNEIEEPELSVFKQIVNLISTGTARPAANDNQDATINGIKFKVRYKYVGNESPDRPFCKAMMSANKLYRKKDIEFMSRQSVNKGLGEHGADTYDIFKYKGGARCHHKWLRQTYMSKQGAGVTPSAGIKPQISTGGARKLGYSPTNSKEVAMKPNDMIYKGFSPNNPNRPSDAR